MTQTIIETWQQTAARLAAKGLLAGTDSLSLRCADRAAMYVGAAAGGVPGASPLATVRRGSDEELHALIYAARPDVGAIAVGGGSFGRLLKVFGGQIPPVFDEQVRHLGLMPAATAGRAGVAAALAGGANAVVLEGRLFWLGMTGWRVALNGELLEKCAHAYVLAAATGAKLRKIPWLVRYIANGRLKKNERHAAAAFARHEIPQDIAGY